MIASMNSNAENIDPPLPAAGGWGPTSRSRLPFSIRILVRTDLLSDVIVFFLSASPIPRGTRLGAKLV